MANGFVGFASQKYFQKLRDVSQTAGRMIASAGGRSNPNWAGLGEGQGFRLGVGTSENVVVRNEIYQNCLAQINQLDGLMAERIEQTVRQMDEMCQSIFIAPQTTPRVQSVLSQVRGALSEFRDVTTQANQVTQMYISQISVADQSVRFSPVPIHVDLHFPDEGHRLSHRKFTHY